MKADVLIVGAGPVGMTMACELARYGLSVRIVDKNTRRTDQSKAIVVWSRTLELLNRMGPGVAGGQGMNTGMHDAFNLAWKLALVSRGLCAAEPLLMSFSAERSAVAKLVLEATGRATTMAVLNEFAEILEPKLRQPYDSEGLWLVRPDGYVALRARGGDPRAVMRYLRALQN
jgi:2-polyprenyl-6-methoxyphenol hydroxylase-like FAD-dependent oxidoreductase